MLDRQDNEFSIFVGDTVSEGYILDPLVFLNPPFSPLFKLSGIGRPPPDSFAEFATAVWPHFATLNWPHPDVSNFRSLKVLIFILRKGFPGFYSGPRLPPSMFSASAFLLSFLHSPPKAERLRSRFDDMRPVGDPVQQCLA
jgi:hypothetical protein